MLYNLITKIILSQTLKSAHTRNLAAIDFEKLKTHYFKTKFKKHKSLEIHQPPPTLCPPTCEKGYMTNTIKEK